MKTLDRYVIRELLLPTVLSLVLLTFVLVIPTILRDAEQLIAKGVDWATVGHVLVLLLPASLSLTIPMSVLIGILIGFGRLSADREFVAMQACGVSLYRLIRPVALIAVLATAADAYEIIVALPDANQTYREITFNVVANLAESSVKPRVFFTAFPNRTLYARDVVSRTGWRDVFLADTTDPRQTTVYFAKEGRLVVNRDQRSVVLELREGTRHTTSIQKAEEYEGGNYDSVVIQLDPDTVFPKSTINRSVTEMSIADLQKSIAEGAKHHDPGNLQRFMIQQKFSIPAASIVLALIGLALGVSHRKDGRLASFALGFGVIFTYYVVLWTSRAGAITGRFPAGLAPWMPNVLFGGAGVALLLWRSRSADQPIRLSVPAFWSRRSANPTPSTPSTAALPLPGPRRRVVVVVRIPHFDWPRPTLLDVYVSSQYVRIFFLGVVSLLGVFYISTFMDLADKLFRGSATTPMLLRYFYFQTPQYVYYIIPMSVLVATLVTIGVMTKNSELVVMRACGISLYRTSLPLLIFGLGASAVLFGLQERVIAFSNREADRLNRMIRGLPPASFGALDRRWLVGENGDVYHYDLFDSKKNEFSQFTVHRMSESQWGLASMVHADRVVLARTVGADGRVATTWKARKGWSRTFTMTTRNGVTRTAVAYVPFDEQAVSLEPPGYFKSDEPDAALMTYGELKDYAAKLSAGGFNVIPELVALQRKVAFPFVTVVMTLLAVPFAVSTGRRGALYGVGIGIVLAIVYWLMVSVFAAVGSGGILSPIMAAWAPNVLFSAAALYMILTVKT